MSAAAPIPDALILAEAAVLAALNALSPAGSAHWRGAPVDSTRRLQLAVASPDHPDALARVYVAQHQDGGGQQVELLNRRVWEGLIVVRVLAAAPALADAGFALVPPALAALAPPDGYHLRAVWRRPLDIPPTPPICTRAGVWALTIRRTTP